MHDKWDQVEVTVRIGVKDSDLALIKSFNRKYFRFYSMPRKLFCHTFTMTAKIGCQQRLVFVYCVNCMCFFGFVHKLLSINLIVMQAILPIA